MNTEIILDNARIVFEDVVIRGHMVLRGDRIAVVDRGCLGLDNAHDMKGDLLVPLPRHHDNVQGLLRTAWWLHARIGLDLPEAFDTLVSAPARRLEYDDCAALTVGRRANLARVLWCADGLIGRAYWHEGQYHESLERDGTAPRVHQPSYL